MADPNVYFNAIYSNFFSAPIAPGGNLLTGRFYKKQELPIRIAFCVSFQSNHNMVVFYGVSNMQVCRSRLSEWATFWVLW